MFANVTQVFISLEALLLRVAMLPDASILARWNQNLHFRRVRLEHLIDSAFIVRSICRTRKKSWFDLFHICFTTASSLMLFFVSTATWISPLSGLAPTCSLRQVRRLEYPCLRTFHSPSP